MTQDEIIEMASQCDIDPHDMCEDPRIAINSLKDFAKLIAEKERNRLADELQKMPLNDTANSIAIWIRGQK